MNPIVSLAKLLKKQFKITGSLRSPVYGWQALRLIGWTKTSVNPGDVITVRMDVAKNGNDDRKH